MMNNVETHQLAEENIRLQRELHHLHAAFDLAHHLGRILDLDALTAALAQKALELTRYQRALVLVLDEDETTLKYGALLPELADADDTRALRSALISTYGAANASPVTRWVQGELVTATIEAAGDGSPLEWLLRKLGTDAMFGLPLMLGDKLTGVLLVGDHPNPKRLESDQALLHSLAASMAVALENARVHTRTMDKLAGKMRELYILRQIDRELNDTIALEHVFAMTLDWALRYTNGHAASLALFDESTGELRYVADLGYDLPREQLVMIRAGNTTSTLHRTAHSGRPEVTPDVTMDKDYLRLSSAMRAQLCAPIMREDRVIAVVSVESRRLNAFTEEHVDFVEKLGARAGVAIDNARLFTETARQREKLSRILRNIADAVAVVNVDGNVELINQAAVSALRLAVDRDYVGQPARRVFEDYPAVLNLFQRVAESGQPTIGDVDAPGDRTYHANVAQYEGIGSILVMNDVTALKETDRLKSELVATVSHDLKQPLSVMHGYTELLMMTPRPDPYVINYTKMIQRSIANMRQLIDDLLDLAKIESGVQIDPSPVHLRGIIDYCVDAMRPVAEIKAMVIAAEVPETLPPIRGERNYLNQIFINLVSNAVKYTPPEGRVRIWAEQNGGNVRIAVQDTGLGISPEDQARIFERFYRVRRPETDSIDGTGLGLAIVKRLIEVHNGQIGLESHLGEGSTFFVTLPVYNS